mgnify:FL=1|jgi:hypothetical protein|tara:strand:- start:92 stop:457 length:366 start_codon:yes stop_codon:yes gene_type:complete
MSKIKIFTVIISMLVAGFAIGFFAAGRMANKRINRHRKMLQNTELERAFISRRIGLSIVQEKTIFHQLDSMLSLQKSIRDDHHTQMKFERNKMFESIKPSLSPEQLKKLKQFNRKQRPPTR